MSRCHCMGSCLALACLLGAASTGRAVEEAAASQTIWHFLGIPRGIQKIRDVTTNRRGNRPGLERETPIRRIADPENLQSDSAAVKLAAKIKTEEDLAPQKIKAIKYLATVGCGCYEGVAEALLAKLDDCSEEVRFEAAIAFCEAAGNPCEYCGGKGCCSAKVMTKLHAVAYEQDENGCYTERSARVRQAAANALAACRRVLPPAGEAPRQGEPDEGETIPEGGPTPAPTPAPLAPMPETDPVTRDEQRPGASRLPSSLALVDGRSRVTVLPPPAKPSQIRIIAALPAGYAEAESGRP
ncbi:MAG: hypothetical protein JW809_13680 [Pirellulales bacterium]|nr:hypothetical protein [Pirellulales bacterium]